MNIVPTARLEWLPPYKTATEKYAPQVRLNDKGELDNYVAGLPFPLLDPNDRQIATKAMWNFSFRPQYTDDVDIRDVEVEKLSGQRAPFPGQIEHFSIEDISPSTAIWDAQRVPPIPDRIRRRNWHATSVRGGAFPFLEQAGASRGSDRFDKRSKTLMSKRDYCWLWNIY